MQAGGDGIEGPRVQHLVAEEVPRRAVEGVAARFRHHIDLRAGGAPVLRAELRGLHLELGERVDDGHIADGVVIGVGVDGSVQQECVVVGATAGGAVGAHLVKTDRVLLYGASTSVGARHQQGQLDELAAVERQGYDLFLADHGTLRHGFRMDTEASTCTDSVVLPTCRPILSCDCCAT